MRSYFSRFNLFAVSANLKETALNTEKTLDTGMMCSKGSIFKLDRRRESNADEAIGKEEPDSIYNLGQMAGMDLVFDKCQPQHAAFILSYALGSSSPAAWGTGYKHTLTPIFGDLDVYRSNPSFTAAMRMGKVHKSRFAGCVADSFKFEFKKDSWLSLSSTIKATGKRTMTVFKEDVTAAYNATSLTLAAKAVAGSTAQERLDAIHQVKVQVPTTLEWVDVVVTAVSAATPAVLTIAAPGGAATSTTYRILYDQAETGDYTWGSFPSRVIESPLRVTDFIVKIGAKWDGSAITGGHSIGFDISSLSWEFNNNSAPEFRPGGTGDYANVVLRNPRTQKLTFDRDFRDYILGQFLDDNETFTVQVKATGAEFETGKNYYVDIVFPKVGILGKPEKENGERLAETADIIILEADTYGSVWAQVANMVSGYAQ